MNHAYKSIWNEATGTFVAVAENVNAKGKRSSSARKGGILAAAGALVFGAGAVVADVVVDEPNNEINFTVDGGSINFGADGSITGLADLTVNGGLTADQLTVKNLADVTNSNNMQVVTGGQLHATNNQVANNTANIGVNKTTLDGHNTRITKNATDIGVNKTTLEGHNTRIKKNADDIATNLTSITEILDELGVVNPDTPTGTGIKYFRANSKAADSQATGQESVAIGPKAVAEGTSSIALGDGAKANKPADGSDPEAAIAIGKNSKSSGKASTAIGENTMASGGNAVAFGSNAVAAGANSVAMGAGAQALADENISIGRGAGVNTNPDIAGDQKENISIGVKAGTGVVGQVNTALGYAAGQNVKGNDNVAFGTNAGKGVDGDENISIGKNANNAVTANRSISIGRDSKALVEGVAIGFNTSAGDNSLALGNGAAAAARGTALGQGANAQGGYVALGAGSVARQEDVAGLSGKFTGGTVASAVSVGSSATDGSGFTRRIVNVAAGSKDTDAVNVGQLQYVVDTAYQGAVVDYEKLAGKMDQDLRDAIAASKSKYVSVNDGDVAKDNKDNNGASAADSVAIGPDAATKLGTSDSVAIGHKVRAEASSAVVLGHDIKGVGVNSTTIGNSLSEARDESGIAIGTKVVSRDENSIVIGRDSYTDRQGTDGPSVKNSIVIGTKSRSTAEEGIVFGYDSLVNAPKGVAQGSNAQATADSAMAFGTGSRASASDSQASGTGAAARAERGIAMGKGARSGQEFPTVDDAVNNRDSIAIGTSSVAEKNSSIALGSRSAATANFAQAFGENARAAAEESIAQGHNAVASAAKAVAVGSDAKATAESAAAFGHNANAAGLGAAAFGAGATAQNTNSVAIGAGAKAESNRSVALGHGAVTTGATGTSSATLNGLTYGGFAGTAPVATVSVGTETEKRTITNVAAGRISNTSTDAINGSQLHATNAVLGNVANTTKNILGGNADLGADGSLTMSNVGNTGKSTIHEAIMSARTEVRKGTNVTGVAKTQGADGHDIYTVNADGTSVSAGAGLAVTPGAKDTNNVTDYKVDLSQGTKDSLVNADSALQTVVTQVDGVDVKTLDKDDNNANFVSGTNIQLSDDGQGGIQVATKEDVVFENTTINNDLTVGGVTKLGDKFVVNNEGNVTYEGDIKNDNHIVNKKYVDKAGEDLTSLGLDFAGNDGEVIHKDLGQQMNIVGGLDMTAESSAANIKTVKNADGDLEIQLSKNLTDLETVTVDNTVTIGGDTNNQTVINEGSVTTNNLEVKGETKLGDKFVVNNEGNVTYEGDIKNDNHIVNKKYVDKAGEDLTSLGLDFAGNDGEVIHKDLGQQMNIVGGLDMTAESSAANIKTVKNADGDLEIQLSKNLTDLETVTVDNTVTIGGDTNNQTIINEGSVTTNNLEVKGETKLGDKFFVNNEGNVTYNVEPDQITNDYQVVNKKYVDKTGGELVTKGLNFAGNNYDENNSETLIHKDLGETLYIEGGLADTEAASNANIRVDAEDGKLQIKLAEKVDLGKNGSVTTGNTVMSNDGLAIDDGAGNSTTITTKGMELADDAGNSNITTAASTTLTDNAGNTNVTTADGMTVANAAGDATTDVGAGLISVEDAKGTTTVAGNQVKVGGDHSIVISGDTGTIGGLQNKEFDPESFTSGQAATEDQLKSVSDVANAGWNVTDADGKSANIGPNGEVKFTGDSNLTVAQTGADDEGVIEITLNKEIDLGEDGSLTTGNTVVNNAGLAVDDKAGNTTNVAADGVTIAGDKGTTQLGSTQITVGGEFPIAINGGTGMITGLQNKDWSDPTFGTKGRAATEEQLKPLGDFLGFKDGDYTFNYNGKDHGDLASALDSIHWNVEAPEAGDNTGGSGTGGSSGNDGSNSGSGNVTTTPISNTNTVGFAGDENISVSKTERKDAAGKVVGADIQVALEKDLKVNSITAIDVNATNVNTGSVNISNGGPVINSDGINMNDKKITNVAAGEAPTDAVNVSQLEGVQNNLSNEIGSVRRDLHKVDRKLRAGVAAAMATAGLPQAYLPGKSMVAIGGGTWKGESGVALGVSKITDNGKWVFKVSGNASTRGDYGGTVGGGYQW